MSEGANDLRISFPHVGDYHLIFKEMLEMSGCEIITPPPITKRTLELGSKYSPESACVPFKYNLGNYLEAIELGANALCTAVGGCRFEYYFEVHRQILKDLGHNVRFLRANQGNLYNDLHALNPRLSRLDYHSRFWMVFRKFSLIDELADIKRKRIGFQTNNRSFEMFWSHFLGQLPEVHSHVKFSRFARDARAELLSLPIDKPKEPLKVGIIGELYIVMEPASNFRLEDNLAKMGVEIHRWISMSSMLHHGLDGARVPWKFRKWARPYAIHHVGSHGTESIARLHQMIRGGFDGAIHLKPFACMPEMNALPVLHKMCSDHQFPLVSLSFDAHTAETGLMTRLEAFYDMIAYKRHGGLPCMNAI